MERAGWRGRPCNICHGGGAVKRTGLEIRKGANPPYIVGSNPTRDFLDIFYYGNTFNFQCQLAIRYS